MKINTNFLIKNKKTKLLLLIITLIILSYEVSSFTINPHNQKNNSNKKLRKTETKRQDKNLAAPNGGPSNNSTPPQQNSNPQSNNAQVSSPDAKVQTSSGTPPTSISSTVAVNLPSPVKAIKRNCPYIQRDMMELAISILPNFYLSSDLKPEDKENYDKCMTILKLNPNVFADALKTLNQTICDRNLDSKGTIEASLMAGIHALLAKQPVNKDSKIICAEFLKYTNKSEPENATEVRKKIFDAFKTFNPTVPNNKVNYLVTTVLREPNLMKDSTSTEINNLSRKENAATTPGATVGSTGTKDDNGKGSSGNNNPNPDSPNMNSNSPSTNTGSNKPAATTNDTKNTTNNTNGGTTNSTNDSANNALPGLATNAATKKNKKR